MSQYSRLLLSLLLFSKSQSLGLHEDEQQQGKRRRDTEIKPVTDSMAAVIKGSIIFSFLGISTNFSIGSKKLTEAERTRQ